ncbi:MAG TPA: DNA polymerase IV, partial [Candidatus Kapabacteria bacterium]|nr:DNA polymerase IV [Candidatus Kapabacteria bacterium]
MQRIICHLDMDAFFASVEEKHDPSLKGKPVLVAAGPIGRGAVASCNYVARRLGVKTGMSTQEAIRNFPEAVVVRANYEWYQEASEQILRIIYRFTPDVEPLSLDEAFFELTHVQSAAADWHDPLTTAQAIQKTIDEELGLGASIGISSGKALAKIASDFKKPHGIT